MSENIELYSAHVITRTELEEVILKVGGMLTGQGHIGRISQDGTKHVFIWLDDEEPLPGLDPLYGTHGPATQKLLQVKLGTEPRYALIIEIGMTPGSGLLAVRFALACTQHWPCVVLAASFNVVNVFDREDMLQLQKEGKEFSAYGM